MSLLNRGVSVSPVSSPSPSLQPELKGRPGGAASSSLQRELKSFDTHVQQYGEWFSGYDWALYGCVTYGRRQSQHSAKAKFVQFLREVRKSTKGAVAYIAVPEWRTSGCGLPPIPLHWHFLMGCPPKKAYALSLNCRLFWQPNGSSDIRAYCPKENGAFYIAKTAKYIDFDYLFHNLGRVPYGGSQDLLAQMALNPYVPEHAKWNAGLETLALRAPTSAYD